MSIVRVVHKKNYLVVLDSTVLDPRLPLAVRAFLLSLLTLPDNWRLNLRDLARRFHVNKDTAAKYLLALERAGYCKITKARFSSGTFVAEYLILEPVLKNRTGGQSLNTSPAMSDVLNYP